MKPHSCFLHQADRRAKLLSFILFPSTSLHLIALRILCQNIHEKIMPNSKTKALIRILSGQKLMKK
jgi:hypothetical protein